MEMYTIDNDAVGKRTLEHLASAKGLGTQVYVIYDGLGSMSLSQRALAALRGSKSLRILVTITSPFLILLVCFEISHDASNKN
jgi:hypothetical protein